ncbi:hypothetical protein N8684_00475 [bacterium]|jgi:hypothetical protein|nr:hypothetical protein [bacterium]
MDMSESNRFEQIEKYLSDELSGKDLTDFESQVSNDAKLAEEIDFQRNIESMLAHRPEDDLRANLNTLDTKYSKLSDGSRKYVLLGIGLVLIVGILGWWMNKTNNNSADSDPNEPTKELTQSKTEKGKKEAVLTEDSEQIDEEVKEEVPESPTKKIPSATESAQKTNQQKTTKHRPIAANFEPNEWLERRLGNLRSDGFNVVATESNLSLKNGKIDFILKGIFKMDESIEDKELTLHIFSNKMDDYENFKPKFSKILPLEKIEEGFEFKLFEPIQLNQGLFYFQIEDEIGEVLLMDKFTVN